jgi:hypothetical protein
MTPHDSISYIVKAVQNTMDGLTSPCTTGTGPGRSVSGPGFTFDTDWGGSQLCAFNLIQWLGVGIQGAGEIRLLPYLETVIFVLGWGTSVP